MATILFMFFTASAVCKIIYLLAMVIPYYFMLKLYITNRPKEKVVRMTTQEAQSGR